MIIIGRNDGGFNCFSFQFFYILLNYKSKRIELEAVLIESSLLDEIIRTSNVEEYAKGVIQDLAP